MKAAIVIPARLESTRLPRKLLLAETGRPLLAHTVERALAAAAASDGLITEVICAVDDESLAEAARAAGAGAVMTPVDCPSGSDRIAIVARDLDCDVVVNLQGDEPEAEPGSLVTVARLLEEGAASLASPAPMGTLAVPIRSEAEADDPSVVKVVVDQGGNALYFSRAKIPHLREGGAPATRLRHLGIYSYRREFLLSYASLPASELEDSEKLEQLRALSAGHSIKVAVVESSPAGIDTIDDYRAFVERCAAAGGREG